MRFVVLAAILLVIPVLMHWIRQDPRARYLIITALGVFAFLSGVVKLDASLISWPLWNGTVRGLTFTFADSMAVALILTRPRMQGGLPFLWVFLVYAGVTFLAGILATVPMASMFYWFQLLKMILLFWALVPEFSAPKAVHSVLNGLAIGLIIQAGYVVVQKAQGIVQAHGTMIHQNTLGFMTELALIPIMAGLLAGYRSRIGQLGILAGLVIVAGGGSRASLLFCSISAAVLLLLSMIQKMTPLKGRIAGAGMVVALLVAPLAYSTLQTRFAGGSVFAEEAQRSAMERAARGMASDHLLGVGPNMYVSTANVQGYSQRAGVTWSSATRAAPVHNAYLLARAETGWPGQIAFLLMFVVPIILAFRHAFRNRTGFDGAMALGAAVALTAAAVHSNYEFVAHTYNPQFLVFINFALAAGMIRARQVANRRKGGRPVARTRLATA